MTKEAQTQKKHNKKRNEKREQTRIDVYPNLYTADLRCNFGLSQRMIGNRLREQRRKAANDTCKNMELSLVERAFQTRFSWTCTIYICGAYTRTHVLYSYDKMDIRSMCFFFIIFASLLLFYPHFSSSSSLSFQHFFIQ